MEYKNRKTPRLYAHDYLDGYYFVTICVKDRKECLGKIVNNKMILNKLGKIAERQWLWLEKNFKYVRLGRYIVMPNHLHGIIVIDRLNTGDVVRTGLDLSLQYKILPLSNIIGAFKTTSSKLIHGLGFKDFNWQRSFYDRILRNEKGLENANNYILNNPLNWEQDRNNLENLLM